MRELSANSQRDARFETLQATPLQNLLLRRLADPVMWSNHGISYLETGEPASVESTTALAIGAIPAGRAVYPTLVTGEKIAAPVAARAAGLVFDGFGASIGVAASVNEHQQRAAEEQRIFEKYNSMDYIATLLNRQYGQHVTEEEVLALLKKLPKKKDELLLPICSRFCQNWDFVHRDMPCHLRN